MRIQVVLPLVLLGAGAFTASVSALGGGGGPPPNPAIAYVDGGVRVMNADGTNSRLVVATKGADWARFPCWSPDNTQLAFCGRLKGSEGVWVVNLDGTGLRFVTSHVPFVASVVDWSPVVAPDGHSKLVFSQLDPTGSDVDLWVVNPDGSGLQNLTGALDDYEYEGSWTRDGTGIYLVRDDPADSLAPELVLLSVGAAAGGGIEITGETTLVSGNVGLAFPRAANSHDWVVYSSMGAAVGPMYAYLLDVTTTPVRLTSGAGDERWCSFSPDDTKVAFHRNGRTGGIFTINVDGTGETRINKNGSDPAWKRP